MAQQPPKTVRGYELRERIGEGGFGAVYRAYQAVVDREVAVKVILPEYANDPDFVRNFETEARLIARLEHPYIVPLFDFWREPDGAYLVMRFFPAGSLNCLLENKGALPIEKVAELLTQIGGALDIAHRHQVIHRDIKPENILMDEDENAYLADFGIAKKVEQDKPASPEPENFSGTLLYAAPELLQSQPATPLSDIYALGFVAYQMLTGVHPFANENPLMMLMSHLERMLPAVDGVAPAVNAALWKATAKEPEDRYATARLFARDFQEGLQSQAQSTGPMKVLDLNLFSMDEPVNPYKGLLAFQEADAMDFFGREALLKQILDQMGGDGRWHNFLAVVGPSGSGKSSVVHAGLLPALRNGKLPGSGKWFILTMTPGPRPLQQLKTALLSIAIDPSDTLSGRLQSGPRGLLQAIDDVLQIKQDLLLVIDQFEEVFTLVEDEQERQHFLELLHTAVTAPESHLRLVITLRADFYDRPLLYENFGALVQARTQVVLPLSAAGGRPVRAVIPQGNNLALWQVESGEQIRLYQGGSAPVSAFAFSPDGQTLAGLSRDGTLWLWGVETGNEIRHVNIGGGSPFLVFSPDGQTLVTGGGTKDFVVRNLNGAELQRVTGHANNVTSFAFSADGTHALSGSADNTVIMWDTSTWTAIGHYAEQSTNIWQVAFSPDQKTFLSAANNIILWRADPVSLAEVRGWIAANRYLPPDHSTQG